MTLPGAPWASGYTVAAHTGLPGELTDAPLAPGQVLAVPARTVVVLQAEVPSKRAAPLHPTTVV